MMLRCYTGKDMKGQVTSGIVHLSIMKRARSFLTNPLILTATLCAIQLALFLWLTMHPFSISPEGRTYYPLRGQGSYGSYIRQSMEGAWKTYNPFTTRPNSAVYIHLFYVIVGKIGALLSLDPVTTTMGTRVVAGILLFFATCWFIRVVIPKKLHLLAILCTLGIQTGPVLSNLHTWESIISAKPAIFSYYPQELVLRHFSLPHHVCSEVFGLLLLGNIFLYAKQSTSLRIVTIGALAIVGTLVMPVYNSMLVCAVFSAWVLWSLRHGDTKKIPLLLAFITLLIMLVGLFTKGQMNSSYPLKDFNLDEKRWVTDSEVLINYFFSVLLFIPVVSSFLVILPFIWKRLQAPIRLLITLSISWIVVPVLLIPLTHFTLFPFANFRLVDGYMYVPIGILTAIAIDELANMFKKRWIAYASIIVMLLVSLGLTINYTKQLLDEQNIIWTNVYILDEEWDAVRFLGTVPKQSNIFVIKYFGEIIPVYATVRTFLGESPGMVDWDEKYMIASSFYSGNMTDDEAKALLLRENISYVYWGIDEKGFLKTNTFYPNVLTPVFQNRSVSIFRYSKSVNRAPAN